MGFTKLTQVEFRHVIPTLRNAIAARRWAVHKHQIASLLRTILDIRDLLLPLENCAWFYAVLLTGHPPFGVHLRWHLWRETRFSVRLFTSGERLTSRFAFPMIPLACNIHPQPPFMLFNTWQSLYPLIGDPDSCQYVKYSQLYDSPQPPRSGKSKTKGMSNGLGETLSLHHQHRKNYGAVLTFVQEASETLHKMHFDGMYVRNLHPIMSSVS